MVGKKTADFLIIGAQKCGTSSLYQYVTSNLMIGTASQKEIHYFDHFYDRGEKWYKKQFDKSQRQIMGEASPYYLLHPEAPRRAKQYYSGLKLITILRNPVERAWSHYQMNCRNGNETLEFLPALQAEEERLKKCSTPDEVNNPIALYSYKLRGVYVQQLDRWLGHFSRDQLLIIKYEEFFSDPWFHVQRVYKFLNVAPFYGVSIFQKNTSPAEKKMPLEARKYLEEYFRGPNLELANKYKISFE